MRVLRQLHVLVWYCSACCARDVHVLRACCARVVRQNRFEPVWTGLNHISREMCFETDFLRNTSRCMSLFGVVLHVVHVMFTCYARAVRQNQFIPVQTGLNRSKPGKTQEKSATSAVVTSYINRSATAIAITTVLRSLQSTSIQHHSHAAALRDTATVAVHQVLQASIIYYLCLYEC